ncbi:NEAT domain-containing protein [Paenibacillus sp. WLX2291]|uniref:NEAT domain-containing protein n=1 Tax=Paenibacillus sp. WLX2291 TaxID=3296934 RepID=UPI003983E3CD
MTLKRRFAPYVIKCIVFVMLFSMISPALPSAFAEDTGSGDSSSVSADTYGDSSSGTVSNDTYSPAETPIYVPSQDPLSQFNYSTATTATYDTYADGQYTIGYKVVRTTDTSREVTAFRESYGNADRPGRVIVDNGKYTFSFRGVNANGFVDLTATQNNHTNAAVYTEETDFVTNADGKKVKTNFTRVSFDVYDLNSQITLNYKFNDLDGSGYLILDPSTLTPITPVVTEPETPVDPDIVEAAKGTTKDITYTALKDGTTQSSSMNNYMVNPAKFVITSNNKKYVQLTLKSSSQITGFQTQVGTNYIDAGIISKDSTNNTRTIQFAADALTVDSKVISAKVHVVTTIPTGQVYDSWYTVQLQFDTSVLNEVTSEDIQYNVYKDQTNEVSILDGYLVKPAQLITQNGKKYIRLKVKSSDLILSFQTPINGVNTEAETVESDTANNMRTIQFPVDDLSQKLTAYTHIYIPDLNYDHWYYVQFQFDSSSLPENPNTGSSLTPEPIKLQDGSYTIDFSALKSDSDEASTMGNYLGQTADLTVKNGLYNVSLAVKSSNIIPSFKVEEDGTFVETTKVSEDTDNNQRIVSFSTKQLQTIMNAQVHVQMPNYDMTHNLRLQFNPDSIQSVSTTPDGMADGKYSASLTAYKYGTKEISVMDEYLGKPATILKKSGKYYVQVTLKNSSWIKTFKVGGQDAQVIETSGDTRVVQFPVTELPRKVKINTHVIVPGLEIGGVAYDHTYDVDLQIGSLMPYEAPKLSAATTTVPLDFTNLAAGKYKLPFSIVMPGVAAGTSSPLDRFMSSEEPVQLTVENGSRYVTMTLNNGNNIKALRVSNDGSYTDAEVVSSDEAKNTKTVKFSVSDYTQNVPAQLVTTGGVSIASTTDSSDTVYDFAFKFDTASVTADSSTTDTANGKRTNNIANGDYTATYRILKNGSDADSVLTPYLDRTAKLTAKDGKVYATITIADGEAVPVFMTDYEGKYTAPEVVSQSQDGKSRTVTFEVPDLDSKLSIFAHAHVSSRYMNNEKLGGQLLFDRATLKSNDGTTETQPAPTTEATPANPSGTTGTVPAEEATTGTNGSSDTGTTVTAQKYSINVKVYKDKSSELSVMNDYVTPTATLVEENGVTYAELTLKNGSWMPVLQVEQDGALKDVEKVSSTGATTVVRFKVDNLSSKINAYTHVVVPGLVIGGVPYDHWYTVQFQFDEASKKELS